MTLDLSAHLSADSQRRLLLFTALLLWASMTFQAASSPAPLSDVNATVFEHPPAYLHPTEVIGFDLSGLPRSGDSAAAALRAAADSELDPAARAQTHLALAVYYKQHGKTGLAETEKRKGDYWARVARIESEDTVDAR